MIPTPDEVAASLTAEEIDAFCREWTSGDPEFDAPDVMLKAICKLAKQSLSPPAGMVGETPETDAACYVMDEYGLSCEMKKLIPADFARLLERRLREAKPVMDMLLLCGEDEGHGLKGATKLRALLDGLIDQRGRAEAAERHAQEKP